MSAPTALIFDSRAGTTLACLVTGSCEVTVVASAEGPDPRAALQGLSAQAGRRLPKEAWVVEPQVFVAKLELPPRDALPPERRAGLIRYELEPLVPASGPLRFAAGEHPGASLLGAALAEETWTRAVATLEPLGLGLAGILPGLGAGVALATTPGQLLEIGPEGLAWSQLDASGALQNWEGGPNLTRADVLALLDPDLALSVLAETAEQAAAFSPDRALVPPAGLSPAAWAGAHAALGLPGGERVPALHGPRPSRLERFSSLAPLAWIAVLALILGGGEFVLRQRESQLTRSLAQVQARADGLREVKREQSALKATLNARRRSLAGLETRIAGLDAADRRSAGLALVLATLATTLPDEIALEGLHDDDQTLRLTGFSLDSAAVQRLSRDLGRALEEARLQPLPARVRATIREGVPGYHFTLELRRVSPSEAPALRTLGPGARQVGTQIAGQRPLRVPRQQIAGGAQ